MAIADLQPQVRISRAADPAVMGGDYNLVAKYDYTMSNFPIVDFSWTQTQMGDYGQGSLTANKDLALQYRDRIEIYCYGERKYFGYVTRIPQTGSGAKLWEYRLDGYINQLGQIMIKELVWAGKTAGYVGPCIEDLIKNHIAPRTEINNYVDLIDIDYQGFGDWDGFIDGLEFSWRTPIEILNTLVEFCGDEYHYGIELYDPSKSVSSQRLKLYFRKKNTAVTQAYVAGKQLTEFKPEQDCDKIKNVIYVNVGKMSNGEDHFHMFKDLDSIHKYGYLEKKVTLPSSYPKYGDKDIMREAGAIAHCDGYGFVTADDTTKIYDGDPLTYWDSLEDQVGGVELWSKLNNETAITTVERGDNGEVIGAPEFDTCYFTTPGAAGIVTSVNNYCRFPTNSNEIDMESGAIELWFKAPWSATSGNGGILWSCVQWEENDAGVPEKKTSGIEFGFHYNTTSTYSKKFYVNVYRDGKIGNKHFLVSPVQSFLAGDVMHLAVSWDNKGKDLPKQITDYNAASRCTLALWINGTKVAHDTDTWESANVNNWLTIGVGTNNENAIGGVIENLKTYSSPKGSSIFNPDTIKIQAAQQDPQYLLIEFAESRQIGQIRLVCAGTDTGGDVSKDSYPKGLKIEVQGDRAKWRTVYEKYNNSQSDLLVSYMPYQRMDWTTEDASAWDYTTKIKISLTKSSDFHWRIYSFEAYEFEYSDIAHYANNQLDLLKDPIDKANVTLHQLTSVPDCTGQVRIIDYAGKKWEYEPKSVKFSAKTNSATMELGDIEPSLSQRFKDLQRQMMLAEYSSDKKSSNVASGSGLMNDAIQTEHISEILADSIIAGRLMSRNFDATHGLSFDLDEAILQVRETDGLIIESGGGVNIGTNGNLRGGQTAYDTGTGFWLGYSTNYKFSIGNSSGNKLTFDGTNLTLTGSITASTGSIGGWTLNSTQIYKTTAGAGVILDSSVPSIKVTDNVTDRVFLGKSGGDYLLECKDHVGNSVFKASAASGNHVAGWVMTNTTLTSGNLVLDSGNNRIGTSDYVANSQGWRINSSGSAEFNDVKIRGTLTATVFDYKQITSTAGSLGVFKSAGKLKTAVTTVASPTTFNIDIDDPEYGHTQLFAVGDILRLKLGLLNSWVTVSSASDQATFWRYVCTLSSGSETTYQAGVSVVDYGPSGQGYLLLTADENNAPYLDIRTHAGAPWTTETTRTRVGNLAGIVDADLSPTGYGIYTDNGYFKGSIWATAGYFGSGKKITIDTNGLTVASGGALEINGDVSVNSNGNIVLDGTSTDWYFNPYYDGVSTYSKLRIYPDSTLVNTQLILGASGTVAPLSNVVKYIAGYASTQISFSYYNSATSAIRNVTIDSAALRTTSSDSTILSLGKNTMPWYDLFVKREGHFGTPELLGNDVGLVHIYGDEAGQDLGGTLKLYPSADYSTTVANYAISAFQSDLRIGPDTDTDALVLTSTGDFRVSTGTLQVNTTATNAQFSVVGSQQTIAQFMFGAATAQRFIIRKNLCGTDTDRAGIVFYDGSTHSAYLWIDDNGDLRFKKDAAPASNDDGDKLNP